MLLSWKLLQSPSLSRWSRGQVTLQIAIVTSRGLFRLSEGVVLASRIDRDELTLAVKIFSALMQGQQNYVVLTRGSDISCSPCLGSLMPGGTLSCNIQVFVDKTDHDVVHSAVLFRLRSFAFDPEKSGHHPSSSNSLQQGSDRLCANLRFPPPYL